MANTSNLRATCCVATLLAMTGLATLSACTQLPVAHPQSAAMRVLGASSGAFANTPEAQWSLLNRVTWGANTSTAQEIARVGSAHYLEQQLRPASAAGLPDDIQARIDALTITQKPLQQLVYDLDQMRKEADAIKNDDEKKVAHQAYQKELNRMADEASSRAMLRALYSPHQLQEQMTWFWLNHFSVHRNKGSLRVLVGDYEQNAIRAHALGSFRQLLAATVSHPAMLRYLDNEQNAVNRLNENYARELMELHTLGVGGGYSQTDVQELARVLTGMGVNMTRDDAKVRQPLQAHYVRRGLFEFNPQRHDFTDKNLLGHTIKGRGMAEVDEALDILARHPSTARHVSRKLATFFVGDEPSAALVDRLAEAFMASDGDIATVLRTLFESDEFARSLGHKFKDPVHYVMSTVRLAYDDRHILNTGPLANWLNRMGQSWFGRETPDGYPLTQAAWTSSGQMTTRFEIAKTMGSGSAGLFKTDGPLPKDANASAPLASALSYQAMRNKLGAPTRQALDQAATPQEWNMLLLASPEFMNR